MTNEQLKKMQEDDQSGPSPEEITELLKQSILRHYPNPERKGCPGTAALHEIAEQRLPFEDARWAHVERCSPCYREFLDFREQFKKKQQSSKTRTKAMAATAALAIVAIVSIWVARERFGNDSPVSSGTTVAQNATIGSQQATPIAFVDFQNQSLTRSPNTAPVSDGQLPSVPHGRVALTINLPIGSAPGEYTLRLLTSESDSTALGTFTSVADMDKGATVLRVNADLSSIAPGLYLMAIRHADYSWAYYKFRII